MFKFLNRERFLATINNWILDGSKLESFGSYQDGEWVVLRGVGNVREEFYLFHTEEAYTQATNFLPWDE